MQIATRLDLTGQNDNIDVIDPRSFIFINIITVEEPTNTYGCIAHVGRQVEYFLLPTGIAGLPPKGRPVSVIRRDEESNFIKVIIDVSPQPEVDLRVRSGS